jgi:hypothetical protein
LRPFTLARQSQFRADGPPDLESAQWAEDYNEVKVWGASKLDGTARSGSGSGR